MAWRDNLRDASFRSVPFFVEVAERSGGRRLVVHEYPLRDQPYIQDLGRGPRAFPVEGYVLGPNYMEARDALLDALEQQGPGQLVHPYYGEKRVAAKPFRIRETRDEGGMARFSMEFIEVEQLEPAFPAATTSPKKLIRDAADAADLAVFADFTASYSIDRQPGFALESLAGLVSSAAEGVNAVVKPVVAAEQDLAAFAGAGAVLVGDAAALARRPADLFVSLQAMLAALGAEVFLAGRGLQALVAAYDFTPSIPRPDPDTGTRVREQANFDAMQGFVRRMIAVQAARLAPEETFDSYDAAVAARESVTDLLDAELETAGDDAFPALQQLRAELVRGVPGVSSGLARLLSYTPPVTTSSLVLAYRLYGDVSREADLVARNNLTHPGFVLGGRALTVLSRG